MNKNIFISFFAAVVIPCALILYFAGVDKFIAAIKIVAFLILLLSVGLYLILNSGKDLLDKLSVDFDDGLGITSTLLKFMTLMNLVVVILSASTTILTFYGYIPNPNDNSYFLTYTNVVVMILFFTVGLIAYVASLKILKFSTAGYFMAFFISIPHIAVLLGLFPVLFLLAFGPLYFESAKIRALEIEDPKRSPLNQKIN